MPHPEPERREHAPPGDERLLAGRNGLLTQGAAVCDPAARARLIGPRRPER